jgi:hypothetical protein
VLDGALLAPAAGPVHVPDRARRVALVVVDEQREERAPRLDHVEDPGPFDPVFVRWTSTRDRRVPRVR